MENVVMYAKDIFFTRNEFVSNKHFSTSKICNKRQDTLKLLLWQTTNKIGALLHKWYVVLLLPLSILLYCIILSVCVCEHESEHVYVNHDLYVASILFCTFKAFLKIWISQSPIFQSALKKTRNRELWFFAVSTSF